MECRYLEGAKRSREGDTWAGNALLILDGSHCGLMASDPIYEVRTENEKDDRYGKEGEGGGALGLSYGLNCRKRGLGHNKEDGEKLVGV